MKQRHLSVFISRQRYENEGGWGIDVVKKSVRSYLKDHLHNIPPRIALILVAKDV